MTDCIAEPLTFSRLKRQNVQADFRGGRLTSDGGGFLLREMDRALGSIDAIDACIPDPRNAFFVAHSQQTLLTQRTFGIAPGEICGVGSDAMVQAIPLTTVAAPL